MNYRNAKFVTDDGLIDCEIEHPTYGWIPYTINPTDKDETIDNNQLLAAMSVNGDVEPYVPPTQEELDAQVATLIRGERNQKLFSEVDVIAGSALRWDILSPEKKQEWADYRQALLDVPQQNGFPHNVTWPTKP